MNHRRILQYKEKSFNRNWNKTNYSALCQHLHKLSNKFRSKKLQKLPKLKEDHEELDLEKRNRNIISLNENNNDWWIKDLRSEDKRIITTKQMLTDKQGFSKHNSTNFDIKP